MYLLSKHASLGRLSHFIDRILHSHLSIAKRRWEKCPKNISHKGHRQIHSEHLHRLTFLHCTFRTTYGPLQTVNKYIYIHISKPNETKKKKKQYVLNMALIRQHLANVDFILFRTKEHQILIIMNRNTNQFIVVFHGFITFNSIIVNEIRCIEHDATNIFLLFFFLVFNIVLLIEYHNLETFYF